MSNTYFYVDPAAGVGGNGTKEHPFSTVEQARDAVRALPDALRQSDICIYLRGGRYVLSQTIALTTVIAAVNPIQSFGALIRGKRSSLTAASVLGRNE